MPDSDSEDSSSRPSEPGAQGGGTSPPSSGARESRRMRITPEQRRFLGPARSKHDWVGSEEHLSEAASAPPIDRAVPQKSASEAAAPSSGQGSRSRSLPPEHNIAGAAPVSAHSEIEQDVEEEGYSKGPEQRQRTRRAGQPSKLSRALEIQNIALLFGAVFVLGVTFYVGKRFEYWKYLITSRNSVQFSAPEANRFPNASAAELVERGMVEERLGNWKEAADRFIGAKYKNLFYPGLLFRAGKLYYDQGNFDSADTLFERAIAFKEDVDTSNYYRGMIANGRGDYPAAERFYEAASNAAPFNADYFYSWAETLRRDRRPKEALVRYEQAAHRAREAEENICRFKMRVAMLEAGETAEIALELDQKKSAGQLPVDWLMTEAALYIQGGRIDDAVRVVQEARISDNSLLRGHFAACAGDKFFSEASNKYPEIAEACRLQATGLPKSLGR